MALLCARLWSSHIYNALNIKNPLTQSVEPMAVVTSVIGGNEDISEFFGMFLGRPHARHAVQNETLHFRKWDERAFFMRRRTITSGTKRCRVAQHYTKHIALHFPYGCRLPQEEATS